MRAAVCSIAFGATSSVYASVELMLATAISKAPMPATLSVTLVS